MEDLKHCRVCHFVKPASSFYPHQGRECKECTKARIANHRANNIEKIREYDRQRARLPHRVENAKRIGKEWRENNPDRRDAQIKLLNAIRSGKVVRWPVCAVPECNGKPEAHHPDYSRPFDVVWLCPAHHKQVHAMAKKLKKAA